MIVRVAEIVNKDTVVVYSPKVTTPVAVRYGWADNPVVTYQITAEPEPTTGKVSRSIISNCSLFLF
ncbi:MAG: hypothetical protein LBL62_09280 [Planctomycetaceae bacterium]|nr:hypothetical protein [Planctomycetaceae bacterium]